MNRKVFFAALVLLMGLASQGWAQTFTLTNADGVRLKYTISGTTVSVMRADGATYSGVLNIPGSVTYNGITYTVTIVKMNAFSNCTGLTSVNIPDGVTSISYGAFYKCSSISAVSLPSTLTNIGESAFFQCSSLASINIPASVTNIGPTAFQECSSLTSITIPDGVTSINHTTFYRCSNLTSVNLPSTVTTIASSAFAACSTLTSIIIPATVTSIGSYAFQNCSSLTSITIPDGVTSINQATFSGCSGLTSIVIPSTVTSFGISAFEGCSSLTSISIPSTLTSLPNSVFKNCSSLTSVDLPATVISFGTSAFEGCSSLTSISIPSTLTSLPNSVFKNCSSLTSIDIPASITNIGSSVFDGCTSLTSVNYLGTFEQWMSMPISSRPPQSYNLSINGEYISQWIIPNGTTTVGVNFSGVSSLRSVVIPNSVTSIAAYAFDGCRLDSLTIGSGVTSIGSYAFRSDTLSYLNYNCTANILGAFVKTRLATVIIGDNVTTLPNSAFSGYSSLTSVVLPSGLTDIPSSAFNNCSSLSSITIPAGVTNIGSSAFNNCSSLSSIIIPAGVTSIGSSAFYNCTGLTVVNFLGTPVQWMQINFNGSNSNPVQYSHSIIFGGGEQLTRLEIPEGTTSVGSNCAYISSLRSVVIPNSVTSIAAYAFDGCQLDSLTIGSGLTSIGSYAFRGDTLSYLSYNCSANIMGAFVKSRLATVVVGDNITSLPSSAFSGCTALTSVVLPSSLTSLPSSAFSGCTALTSVVLPSCLTSIGYSAFNGCSSLATITIPAGVTSIGHSAFNGCSSLTAITIPAGVTSIDYNTFNGCTGLSEVNFLGVPEQWMQIAFDGSNSNPIAYSHSLSINGAPLTRLEFADTTTVINKNFAGITSLQSVVIPDGVTTIPYRAFEDCWLDSLTIGSGLTTIGTYAFVGNTISYLNYNCTANIMGAIAKDSLRTVVIGNQITSLPSLAFADCSSLTSVTFPDGLTSIGYRAFRGDTSLASATIPTSVTYLGEEAFLNCTGLSTLVYNTDSCTIGSHPFSGCSNITSITIGDNVSTIPGGLFDGLTSPATLYLSNNVDSIGHNTFNGSLAATHFSGTLEEFMSIKLAGAASSPVYASHNLYLNDTLLTNLVIPSGITSVGYHFAGDTTLNSITFNEGVTSIGNYAFQGCGRFSTIRIPNSVTTIGYSFSGTEIDSLFIGTGLTGIASNAFGLVRNLYYNSDGFVMGSWTQGHNSPGGWVPSHFVPTISDYDSLETIVVGDSVTRIPDGWLQTGLSNGGYHSLRSVVIGSGVDTIGRIAFQDAGVQSVLIPDNVRYIGEFAFQECSYLTSITLPSTLSAIEEHTFVGCSSLRNIVIPDSVTYIGYRAFWGCSSLKSITIPDNVTELGNDAFRFCYGLDSVIIGKGLSLGVTHTTFVEDTIKYLSYNCPADIPNALWYKDSLLTVVIGDSVTYINDDAFSGASSLTSITIPASVWYVGENAFAGCTAMDSITFLGTNAPSFDYTNTGAGNVVPFSYLNLIRVPCGSYSSYYNALHGNSAGYVVYDQLNDQYFAWDTVLARILQESQVDLTFSALTADANQGEALVWYHEAWLPSAEAPQPAHCADSSVTVKAVANYGYHFDHWSDGTTANPTTLHLAGNSSLTAYFAPNQYTVTLHSSNNSYGTVAGGGPYTYLDTALIEATAATHYHFLRWNDGSRENPRHVLVDANITLTAIFVPDTHHVTVSTNGNYGTVTGTNDYAYGTTVQVRATPAGGYYFVRWADGSTANPTTFICHGDTTVTAIFSPVVTPEICMVSVEEERNVLLWDTEELPIVSYTVYREGTTSGQYEAVATIPYAEAGRWIDTASRPVNRSYRYRLSATDTCGNESAKSGVHKTMHLTISQGVSGTWNLVWTAYEGADYSTYVIYRGTSASDIQQIDIMPSAGNTTYSDPDAPAGEVYYQVGVMMANPCGASTKATTVSRSNIASSNNPGTPEGIGDIDVSNIHIYSVDGRIVVEGAEGEAVRVFDIVGRQVENRSLPRGVYLVKVGNRPALKTVVTK